MNKLRIHFVVPASSVSAAIPAPHHQSGIIHTPEMRQAGLPALGSGQVSVVACNPAIVFSEWDNATGEPWAVACEHCVMTDVWKAAAKGNPHPRLAGRPDEAVDVRAAIAKECC